MFQTNEDMDSSRSIMQNSDSFYPPHMTFFKKLEASNSLTEQIFLIQQQSLICPNVWRETAEVK